MMKRGACLFVVAVFCSVYVSPAAVLAADCFSDPTQAACGSFQLNSTAVMSDLQQLCMPNGTMNSVGWPSACALLEQCNAGNASSTYCAPLTLLRTACQETSDSYCTPYESLCSSGSLVPACSSQLPVPLVPSAMSAANATATMCKSMPDMPGCITCSMALRPNGTVAVQSIEMQCPNPLLSLSQACLDMYMTGCDLWNNFCKATSNNAGFPFLCKGTSSSGSVSPPSSGMNMNMNMTPSGSSPSPSSTSPSISLAPSPETTSPCFSDPTKSSCQNFTLSDATVNSYLSSLCAAMPNMVGCTFWNECKNDGTTTSWCNPFSLYATICTEMPSMKDCKSYSELCGVTGTAVLQCSLSSPIPGAPTTSQATQEVLQMCSEMSMSGCENCTSTSECPDPMGTLSEVCLGMSGMAGCSSFYSMCTMIETTFTSLCGYESSSEYLPPMKMWLHASITDILLIKEWVPRNGGQYAASCLAVIAAAILVQAFKAMRVSLEAQWALKSRNQSASCCPPGSACNQPGRGKESLSEQGLAGPSSYSGSSVVGRNGSGCRNTLTSMFAFGLPVREQMGRNTIRAGFTAIVVFLDYMLMLIVMSFNIGIILSAVAGFTIGAFLFGHSGEMTRGASVLSVGEIAPDSENDLEVHFVDPQTCCNSRMV